MKTLSGKILLRLVFVFSVFAFFVTSVQAPQARASQSITASAGSFMHLDFSQVPQYDGAQLQQLFEYIRDTRFLYTSDHPGFLRRIAWLYPDSGCFARATLVGKLLEEKGLPLPAKIWVFGVWANLRLRTAYISGGVAWWDFHVASLVAVGNQYYVLDPAVDPQRPLHYIEWIHRVSVDVFKNRVAVCSPYGYNPDNDPCDEGPSPTLDQAALKDHEEMLKSEWDRLVELGRNPESELGDSPPWKMRY